MRILRPVAVCPDETATCCSPTGSTVVPPGFDLVGYNFAFQYDEENQRWQLYIVQNGTEEDATVYGHLVWVTDDQQVYVDDAVALSTELPSDVSIATLGYNYKFQNNYLYIANFDSNGTWHKVWVTADQQLYADEGET